MASFLKKTALALLVFFSIVWLGRNWLFNNLFSYKTDSVISAQLIENQSVVIKKPNVGEADSLLRATLEETSEKLQFSFEKCANDPAEIAKTGRANCIGYAAFFKNILEKKLAAVGFLADFRIEHRRGRLYFLRTDIHRFSKSKFWKDHDFVAVRQLSTGAEWTVDPSLFDFLGLGFINNETLLVVSGILSR